MAWQNNAEAGIKHLGKGFHSNGGTSYSTSLGGRTQKGYNPRGLPTCWEAS